MHVSEDYFDDSLQRFLKHLVVREYRVKDLVMDLKPEHFKLEHLFSVGNIPKEGMTSQLMSKLEQVDNITNQLN